VVRCATKQTGVSARDIHMNRAEAMRYIVEIVVDSVPD
jgi:hypothetical protein